MIDELKKLRKNAYSPYYEFPNAAILVAKDGRKFKGVNVENANGTSICAERNAIAAGVAAGYKKGDFDRIYLLLASGEFGTPCFACRQVLQEFMDKTAKVISVNDVGEEKVYTISQLCPYPFDESDL